MKAFEEVDLKEHVEVHPVVRTGYRWPAARERENPDELYQRAPECKQDPRRCSLGSTPAFPEPFARGGGLFPVLLLMDDGTLACVFRTGAPHHGSGGEISISFSEDKGRKWSEYKVVVRGDTGKYLDRRNTALGQAANGDLVLAYGVLSGWDGAGRPVGRGGFLPMQVTRSSDCGATWSDPEEVSPPSGVCLSPYGQMRRLRDGRLVFNARGPYQREEYEKNPRLPERMTYLYWSDDDGRTWGKRTLIRAGKTETGFLPLDEAHWVSYVRHNKNPSTIAHSHDGGMTWSRWEPTLDAGSKRRIGRLPGSLAELPSGLILATYGYRAHPFGVRAIVSKDGGEPFDLTREYVLTDTYLHLDCGYPSTVCFPDGTVVTVAYTIQDIERVDWGTACIAYRYHEAVFDKTRSRMSEPGAC